jgi:hypothetical protein
MEDSIENLLQEVSTLEQKIRILKDERQSKGEYFNIFNIVGLFNQENKFHSALIAELLNAQGSHGLKDAFLKVFIQEIKLDSFSENTLSSSVTPEKPIGTVTDTEGGRIDIVIDFPDKKAILIENKVYASDQENQLLRYYNYGKSEYKNEFSLLYLTLDGQKPSQEFEEEIKYQCISYKENIKHWIERCIEIASQHPLVRETLKQYLAIINQLTMQNMEENQIVELMIGNDDYLRASHLIHTNWILIEKKVFDRFYSFISEICNEVNDKNEYQIEYNIPYNGRVKIEIKMPEWKNHSMDLDFVSQKYSSDFFYAIVHPEGEESLELEQIEKLKEGLSDYNFPDDNLWVTCQKYGEGKYKDWGIEAFIEILRTDKLKDIIKNKILEILEATKGIQM